MIIRDLAEDADNNTLTDIPELVGGKADGTTRPIPTRYVRHLAGWIADNHPHLLDADVVITGTNLAPVSRNATGERLTGPLPRLSTYKTLRDHYERADPQGWYLRVSPYDGDPVEITLYDTGMVQMRDANLAPIEERLAFYQARMESETAPFYRLQAATAARHAAEAHADQARRVQAAEIRAQLRDGGSVRIIAEQTGLSRERVYQIRDDRR